MPLVQAPALGISRYANDAARDNWTLSSSTERDALIHAVYQQVLGQQHVLKSDRLLGSESLFRNGDLSVREFVRSIAHSGLYRSRFFESSNPYRFIELNHKHLLGRAPHDRNEMLHHFTILQEQGYDAEIDSYLDSAEYQERFGLDTVPHVHGWEYSVGLQGRQFSWLMQLARGVSASVKGDGAGHQFKLGRALHQNRPVGVSRLAVGPSYFRAALGTGSSDPVSSGRPDRGPAQSQKLNALNGASDGMVTLSVSGVAYQRYARSGSITMRVPRSCMNEALRRAQRLGGAVTALSVAGC